MTMAMEWTTKFSYCLTTFLCCFLFTQSAPYYDQSFIRTNSSRKLPPNVEPLPHHNRLDINDGHPHSHRDRHSRDTQVSTTTGPLRGFKRNVFGKEVFVYYGIPFAEPPVDELRFKKPVPKQPWTSPLHAVHPPNSCYQEKYALFPGFRGEEQWNPNTNVSEDCLYLNLWVPRSAIMRQRRNQQQLQKNFNSNANANVNNYENGNEYNNNLLLDDAEEEFKGLPILIWIYGGGYMSGTITLDVYNGDILAAENDVIVVAINYRVGAFGFLYFGNEDAPGNQGMYDQVVAMKWVKENAERFGGDPNSITLFGESAGGGSVSFHMLSPVSRDLMTRGILQSGTLNAPWSVMSAYEAKKIALELAEHTGCNETAIQSHEETIACMRDISAFNMSVLQWNTYKGILQFPFAPTIDGEFFPRHPVEMLKDGDFKKTEILIGSNKNEGTYFILYDYIQHFSKDGPNCLSRGTFTEIVNQLFADRSEVEREAILFQYNNWEDVGDGCKSTELFTDVIGDYFFICPTNYFAQAWADHGVPVYYYFFTQRTSSNPWGEWMGVLHADEIEYVFGLPLNFSETHTVAEKELSRRVMQYFATFARTGNPVDERYEMWPMYTRDNPTYFILNADKSESGYGKGPRVQGCAFWNDFMPLITPGTKSLPSRCGRERWDMNAISSYQTSWTTKASSNMAVILVAAVCTQFLYSHLILSSSLFSSWQWPSS